MKKSARGTGDLLARVRAHAAAGDPAHHFSDQPAVGGGVVAVGQPGGHGAPGPPERDDGVPGEDLVGRHRSRPPRPARACGRAGRPPSPAPCRPGRIRASRSATGASTSIRPCCARRLAHMAVTPLVVEYTSTRVSSFPRPPGRDVGDPPHRSTTLCPGGRRRRRRRPRCRRRSSTGTPRAPPRNRAPPSPRSSSWSSPGRSPRVAPASPPVGRGVRPRPTEVCRARRPAHGADDESVVSHSGGLCLRARYASGSSWIKCHQPRTATTANAGHSTE